MRTFGLFLLNALLCKESGHVLRIRHELERHAGIAYSLDAEFDVTYEYGSPAVLLRERIADSLGHIEPVRCRKRHGIELEGILYRRDDYHAVNKS